MPTKTAVSPSKTMKNPATKPPGSAIQQQTALDDTPPPKQTKSITDPPEIETLTAALGREKNLGVEVDKHDAIAAGARSEIETLVSSCNPSDAGKFAQLSGRIAFAEQCVKFLSAQRESARERIALAFEPARRLAARNLRLIVKALIEKETEVLKDRFSDEQKRRNAAAEADEPIKAKARAERFEWSTKVDLSELRNLGVNPEVAQRVLDFWDGVKRELEALGVEPWMYPPTETAVVAAPSV